MFPGREKEYLIAGQNPEETRSWMEAIIASQNLTVRRTLLCQVELFCYASHTHIRLDLCSHSHASIDLLLRT